MKIKSRKDRKVFYVDVGDMSPEELKKYLEKVKKQMQAGKHMKGK